MKLELTHIRLLVKDYKACFRFYKDVLGFEVEWGHVETGYAEFKTGGALLAIFNRHAMALAVLRAELPDDAKVQDRAVVIFRVEDVDATAAELQSRGVTLDTDPIDRPEWGIRTAHFRDPDGNLIEINQPIADSQ